MIIMQSHIDSLDSIRQKFASVQDSHKTHQMELSPIEKLAVFITEKVGTMGFFFTILSWTVLWLGWNIFGPVNLRFDPFPAFVLWLFISNLIQIHLMPLIMVGQNIQGRKAEFRSEHDYETDRKAEKEIETILLHLENQQKVILEILKKVEKLEVKK